MRRFILFKEVFNYLGKFISVFSPLLLSTASIFFLYSLVPFFLFVPLSILLLAVSAYISNVINRFITKNEVFYRALEDSVFERVKKELSIIEERPPKLYPDKPYVDCRTLLNQLGTIKAKGRIEFELESNCELLTGEYKDLIIKIIQPGMHKLFLGVARQLGSREHCDAVIKNISNGGADSRDFAFTWFSVLLPILGGISQGISTKLAGSGEFESYFVLYQGRIIKKKKKDRDYYMLHVFL